MKKTGYIIEKYNCMTNAYTCNRIAEEAGKEDIDIRVIGIYDTHIAGGAVYNAGEKLEPCDFVINRYKWGKLKDEINRLARRSYNPLEGFNVYVNKYEQVRRLSSSGFHMPKYCLGTGALPYRVICEKLGLPFVAKGLENSMGKEILLIEKEEDYHNLAAKYGTDKEWLFEEFIEVSRGRDLRIYSIRGNVIACMQRKSKDDFRANVALGAKVEAYDVTFEMRQAAKDIYEQTGLDFLGIDLLFGNDKPYFCEINVMPGIEGMEKATGVNIAGRIVRTIKEDFADGQESS